tara:strand:+ start:470 stop:775 length:306 start_codon:yes stop_codon:yes gene_type:complete
MKYHELVFDIALYLSYILYIVVYLRIGSSKKYQELLENIMKYYVIGFLLIRFNPFTKNTFTEFDRRIVFSSAIFLLTTTTITEYAKDFGILELFNFSKHIK